MPEQPRRDLIATADQAAAELGQAARIIAAYRKGLLDAGIPPEEVAPLTRDYQQQFFDQLHDMQLVQLQDEQDEG